MSACLGQKHAFIHDHLAVSDAVVEVDAERSDGGSAGSRAPDKAGTIPAEVP